MKNEENKKEIKIYKKQNSNHDHKKTIENNKKSNCYNVPDEKSYKSTKNMNEKQKFTNMKNNDSNLHKIGGQKVYGNKSNYDNLLKNLNINSINLENKDLKKEQNTVNNDNENNEPENSIDSKMFYEVNNNNLLNFNTPVKTINVYRNNFFNYTNNNLLSNLLCDISDDNKNVMVSELDLNISNSQSQTIQPEQPGAPQRKILEKQNTEVDFKSQLQSNIIKILEKNIISKNNNKNKNKNDKISGSYKNIDDSNNKINNKEKKESEPINDERKKQITDINLNSIKIIENKNNNFKVCLGTCEKNNTTNNNNKYLSKMNKKEIKNKYFVSSAKARKSRGLKSPNINVHKVNSIISPNNKNSGNKKMYYNNYTKTDIGIKKYKTIFDNQKNNNHIDSVKYYNQIKQNKNPNTTSKKAIKSYIIYNHNLNNNKIFPNNNHHCIYKISEKNNNIMLTNNSNNNFENSTHQKKKNQNQYSKYKNILNELHKNLSKHYQKKEEKINNSKANSHRNKKNQTYLIFSLENSNGRKSPKKDEIFSSNTSNTIYNKYNLNSISNTNNETNNNNKNIIMMNHSIDKNIKSSNKINVKIVNNLSKQNSDISIIHSQNKAKSILYQKKRWNKNNSCQFNQKNNNILSDSIININYKLNNEVNKIKNNKFKNNNNNVSLFGVEKINIEMNKKSNNSNIDINPKDLYEEKKKLKNKTLSDSQLKKKNSNQKKSNKKSIINKKATNFKIKPKADQNNYNLITFRNKFIYDDSMKKYLSNSKDNKQQKTNNKISKSNFDSNNFNINYNNSSHFSPINKVFKDIKDEKNYYTNYFYNNNAVNYKNKSNKNIIGNSNKINIDINFNNNINYIYIIKKNSIKNKSNNHLFTMK